MKLSKFNHLKFSIFYLNHHSAHMGSSDFKPLDHISEYLVPSRPNAHVVSQPRCVCIT